MLIGQERRHFSKCSTVASRRISFGSHTTNAPVLIVTIHLSRLTVLKTEERKHDYPKCKRVLSTLSRLTRLRSLEKLNHVFGFRWIYESHTHNTAANERRVVGIWGFSISSSLEGQAYTLTKPIKTNFRMRVYGQSLHQLHRNQYHDSPKWYSHI
jgi:hypothetical protein